MLTRLAAELRVVFLGGKGGTGKTTLAAAIAVAAARGGRRVRIVSTDPAHSLGHVFDRPIGPAPVPIEAGLTALELDPDRTVDAHLEQSRGVLRRLMPARLHGEIDRHLEHSRETPGMVEAALLEAMAVTLETGLETDDLVVFDTAPSGHTVRLLVLPELMAAWTEGLIAGRERAERMSAAARVLGADDDARDERDARIRTTLFRRRERFERLRARIAASDTAFLPVLNAERLPVLETLELVPKLRAAGLAVPLALVNKRTPSGLGEFTDERRRQESRYLTRLCEALPGLPVHEIELQSSEIVGTAALGRFAARLGLGG